MNALAPLTSPLFYGLGLLGLVLGLLLVGFARLLARVSPYPSLPASAERGTVLAITGGMISYAWIGLLAEGDGPLGELAATVRTIQSSEASFWGALPLMAALALAWSRLGRDAPHPAAVQFRVRFRPLLWSFAVVMCSLFVLDDWVASESPVDRTAIAAGAITLACILFAWPRMRFAVGPVGVTRPMWGRIAWSRIRECGIDEKRGRTFFRVHHEPLRVAFLLPATMSGHWSVEIDPEDKTRGRDRCEAAGVPGGRVDVGARVSSLTATPSRAR